MRHQKILGSFALTFALILMTASAQQNTSTAAPAPPPSAAPKFSAAELEKLAAPIALHPDPLLALILPASAYPLEIVQAARFVTDTNNLAKLDEQPWDENVKALAKFPTVLQQMNDDLAWTIDLGQAVLNQQKELMDAIQRLRAKANASGVLQNSSQQVIVVTNTIIEKTVEQQIVYVTNTVVQIQPANPQVVYVPTYPPTIYTAPPPGPGPAAPLITFAAGIAVGAVIANNCDWHHGGVVVLRPPPPGPGYRPPPGAVPPGYRPPPGGAPPPGGRPPALASGPGAPGSRPPAPAVASAPGQKWQPNQSHLSSSGAPGSKASAQTAQSRGWSGGSASSASRSPSTPRASRQSAFGGYSSGSSARNSSNRGSVSRSSSSRSFVSISSRRSFGGRSGGGRRR